MAAEQPHAERWRVEELAELTGTSVDTIRFYQKRRLLAPPTKEGRVAWYGPEHRDRLTRIRELRQRGLTLALIGRLVRGELDPTDEPLAAAVVAATSDAEGDIDGDAEELLTLAELGARTGVPDALITAVVDAGLLVPRRFEGEARYTPADVEIIATGMRLIEAGLPIADLLALASEHDARSRATAEHAIALFDAHIRQPLRASDLPDDEKAQALVEAFRVLLPAVSALVAHHFRRLLLSVAQEHLEAVGDATEIAAVSVEATRRYDEVPGA
jgi:DNA-binding transcriptional MerR regulator